MGDLNSSDSSWKKMVIAKANNEWISTIKTEQSDLDPMNITKFSSGETNHYKNVKRELGDNETLMQEGVESMMQEIDPLLIISGQRSKRKNSGPKNETPEERKARLAKMSAYAAQRLANETPEQRMSRLKRMSEYAAKRLAQETHEQRARRLARMSAYAARRLAEETPEQRQARLSRMSAYAARRKTSVQKKRSVHNDSANNSSSQS